MNNFSTSASSDISTSFSSLLSTSGIGNATDDMLFAETFLSDNHEPVVHNTATPTLIEAILEPDNFLKSFGISDTNSSLGANDDCKMEQVEVSNPASSSTTTTESQVSALTMLKFSPNCTPTNVSPITTPKTSSPPSTTGLTNQSDPKFIDQYVGQRLMEEKTKTNTYIGMPSSRCAGSASFRHFYNGLDTIPEYQVTDPPSTYQPLVPPPVPVPKVATTTYNISFPTTLQPRDRFDVWRGHQGFTAPLHINSARFSSGTGSSCSSSVPQSPGSSSLTSPFHEAKASTTYDVSDFHPLNVIESPETGSGNWKGYSSRSSSSNSKFKASKRSRTNSPIREDSDASDGASSRQRRKSNSLGNSSSAETKRRDSIKYGLEELQRTLPQFGTPEEEKISQATILSEAAKYLKSLKQAKNDGTVSLEHVSQKIEEMTLEIEKLQSKLPDNGAIFSMDKNSLVAVRRNLPDQFADHVVERTHDNWKYWVFTSIMGHFVHSFEQEVSAASLSDLQTTSLEWITNSMTLQQLRKDVSRKLAKLNAKTSISEDPSKLPEEAMKYVSYRRQKRSSHFQ